MRRSRREAGAGTSIRALEAGLGPRGSVGRTPTRCGVEASCATRAPRRWVLDASYREGKLRPEAAPARAADMPGSLLRGSRGRSGPPEGTRAGFHHTIRPVATCTCRDIARRRNDRIIARGNASTRSGEVTLSVTCRCRRVVQEEREVSRPQTRLREPRNGGEEELPGEAVLRRGRSRSSDAPVAYPSDQSRSREREIGISQPESR